MESVFDLPTHILVVHAPVVLTPLVAVACAIVFGRPRWRHRFGGFVAVGVVVVVVSLLVAIATGERFDEALAGLVDVSHHEELAATTRNLALAWLLVVLATIGSDRWVRPAVADDGTDPEIAVPAIRRIAPNALAIASIVLAVLVTIWLVRTGHEGARVTWSGVLDR